MPPTDTSTKKKRPEVIIRHMEIDDLASVYHLGQRLFTSEDLPILYRTWDSFEVTGYFTSDPDFCFVAETGGNIVGFLLATTVEKEGTAWNKYGYLSWLGVDESYQRTKLGHRLYRKLEDKMQEYGVRMIIADTEGGNESAVAFFEDIGFSVRGEHLWFAKTLH